jgi:hypothetical protein
MLYGWSLLGGLALTWPALSSAMHGDSDIVAAGIRLLLSVAVLWAGLHLVNSLIGNYAHGVGRALPPAAPLRVEADSSFPGRRREDAPQQLEFAPGPEAAIEAAPEPVE